MRRVAPFGVVLVLAATGCRGALDPQGPEALRTANAWWWLLAMSGAVFALVMVLLGIALWRPRSRIDYGRDRTGFIILGGFVLPMIVLSAVMGLTVETLSHLTRSAPAGALQINVTGRDWWWDVTYPDSGVRTANEIHIPVGRQIAITGTSADVIHSFWAPQLAGKWDFIPGKTAEVLIRADKAGVYRGQCAEFCGISHANMAFFIVAQSEADFERWLRQQEAPGLTASDTRASRGRDVFFNNSCSACHGIKGTPANGTAGPDLTHLASRDYIAGETLRNTDANLAAWVMDARQSKPGANMPSYTQLSSDDLSALVAYLGSLE